MTNLSLFVVVLLSGMTLVLGGLGLALLISPKSYNFQKGEPYECGLPTHGTSWMQFRVGYYLYAILFLMFDVETIFLFPWATVVRSLGTMGLISILVFKSSTYTGFSHYFHLLLMDSIVVNRSVYIVIVHITSLRLLNSSFLFDYSQLLLQNYQNTPTLLNN